MDASSTPQTVAQAVQAATAQQQIAQASPPVQPVQTAQSSTIDNLTCQWQGCGERCDTAEALYDHVCERHVGRKSTNNLNLTCQWGACRTTTVKRDHITSHIRVHVPLKPHKCDFCGKAFKRPQDLKKHVKTHADDSVLMNSPSSGNNRSSMGAAGGMQQNGKPSGYYPAQHDGGMGNPYPTYQPAMGANANGGYPTAGNGQYAGYGSVNYPANTAMADIQSMDTRRRAIEALNDFLGDIKRRAIDPSSYYDVGSRLQNNALPLPVGSGYNTGYNNQSSYAPGYQAAASLFDNFTTGSNMSGGGGVAQLAAHGYQLPLPNARTKNDLQEIDRFLEQLQATVYETSNHSAAAGIQQPGVHAMHTGDYGFGNSHNQYRSSNSPPSYSNNGGSMSGVSMSGVSGMQGMTSSSIDTPALTPAASVSSYTSSGHSPISSHSRSSLGSNQMYPNLPAVTGMSDLGAGYPTTTSAPASGLASGFDSIDGGRRYSGGRLQRARPAEESADTDMMDVEDGARTPKASDKRSKGKNSSIDPALRGEDEKSSSGSVSSPTETTDDKRQEEWVENIRTIENLRKYITSRLEAGDYVEEESNSDGEAKEGATTKSIEIAKMVEEKMADADENSDVKYPALPSA